MNPKQLAVHNRAKEHSNRFRQAEAELMETIQEVERLRVFQAAGYGSLFEYCCQELRLTESVAYNFINVGRKVRHPSRLRSAIRDGELSVTKARKMTAVMTAENEAQWAERAKKLSTRELEKTVVRERPLEACPPRVRYMTSKSVQLIVTLSEETMLKLRELEHLAEADAAVVLTRLIADAYEKRSPERKARRAMVKKGRMSPVEKEREPKTADGERRAVPASVKHQVILRDGRRCSLRHPKTGRRCQSRRYLQLHHRKPVSEGGRHEVENLTTLCAIHHREWHRRERGR